MKYVRKYFFTAAHLQLLRDVTNSFNQLSIIIRLPLCIVFESKIFSNRYFCFFRFDKKNPPTSYCIISEKEINPKNYCIDLDENNLQLFCWCCCYTERTCN